MSAIQRMGEELARAINRRTFLRQTSAAIFAIATAGAVNLIPGSKAAAYGTCPWCPVTNCDTGDTACDFPWGYCSNCSGHNCGSGCSIDKGTHGNGCWCTAWSSVGGCYNGYYICCDCNCGGNTCGCSQLQVLHPQSSDCAPQAAAA